MNLCQWGLSGVLRLHRHGRTPIGVSGILNSPKNLNPTQKFQNPKIYPSGRKVTGSERREKKRSNRGHFVLTATPKGRACASLGPMMPSIMATLYYRKIGGSMFISSKKCWYMGGVVKIFFCLRNTPFPPHYAIFG